MRSLVLLLLFLTQCRPDLRRVDSPQALDDPQPATVIGRIVDESGVPIADAFDALVISAEEKMMKPDPRIYQLALDRLDVRADEAIFLDDVQVNIEACNALGMHGVHFTSSEQAQRDIRALLA